MGPTWGIDGTTYVAAGPGGPGRPRSHRLPRYWILTASAITTYPVVVHRDSETRFQPAEKL